MSLPVLDLPKSRTEAKQLGQPHYFTNQPCQNGHIYKRRASDGHCLKCDSEYQKRKRIRRPDDVSKARKAYYQKTRKHQLQLRRHRYANNPEIRINKKNNDLINNYGITLNDYYEMEKHQDYKCAICGTTEKNKRTKYFDVDHCHETGKVRGLLCTNCNQGLGKFKDNIHLLKQVITYLEHSA